MGKACSMWTRQVFIYTRLNTLFDATLHWKRRVRRTQYRREDDIKQHLPGTRCEGVNDTEFLHFSVQTRTLWWRLKISRVSYRAVFSSQINAWRWNDIIYHGEYNGQINRSYPFLQSLHSSHDTSNMRNYIVTARSASGRQHFSLHYVRSTAPLYMQWGSVQAVRPIRGVEV